MFWELVITEFMGKEGLIFERKHNLWLKVFGEGFGFFFLRFLGFNFTVIDEVGVERRHRSGRKPIDLIEVALIEFALLLLNIERNTEFGV